MKQCVIGIDGGGTKTHLICSDLEGNVLAETFGGASNLCANTYETVKHHIMELVQACVEKLGEAYEIKAVCLGTAGLIAENAETKLRTILKECTQASVIKIVGDMETAMIANLNDETEVGMILISGTGSIGYGMTSFENKYRSGGWGHLVGDEGSAYWIGCEGVKAALKSYDGRGDYTTLYDEMKKILDCDTHQKFISTIYSQQFNKTEMAQLAVVVANESEKGDKIASEILKQAGVELSHLAHSIITKLDLTSFPKFKIIMAGSVFLKNELVRYTFKGKIENTYPKAEIVDLTKDSVYGAVKIALGGLTT